MHDALRRDLEARLDGEVRFDKVSRALYSTDASVYQIEPLGVVIVRSRDDILGAIACARRHGCSITARGGGTSQAGQAIGEGLQLDTSKYFNRLLEVNVDERWARVEPGIVLDELNAQLAPHGLRFAPDISTASRATIGGMISNNSSGARVSSVREDDRPRPRPTAGAGRWHCRPPETAGRRRARRRDGGGHPGGCLLPGRATPGHRARRRDRPSLSEDPPSRWWVQPRCVCRYREKLRPYQAGRRVGRHARHRGRGSAPLGAAADRQGGSNDSSSTNCSTPSQPHQPSSSTGRRPWK